MPPILFTTMQTESFLVQIFLIIPPSHAHCILSKQKKAPAFRRQDDAFGQQELPIYLKLSAFCTFPYCFLRSKLKVMGAKLGRGTFISPILSNTFWAVMANFMRPSATL